MAHSTRILLVDDHSLFREGLGRLLEAEPGFSIAGKCSSAAEAIRVLASEAVDVILLDHDLGSEEGSVLLRYAKSHGLATRILMVTAGMNDADTVNALESGAAGIFLKHSPPSQLVDAIHKLVSGEMWLDSRAVQTLVEATTRKQPPPEPLTARERGVLKSVFEGLSNKEIALRLQISESSVKAALQNLFDKTGVRTRSQLVRIALEKHPRDWIACG